MSVAAGKRWLGESERYQGVAERFVVFVASTRGDNNELFACLLAPECHGRGMRAGGQPGHPEFLAGIFIEGAEAAVVGGTDEHKPACGHDSASEIRSTRGRNTPL